MPVRLLNLDSWPLPFYRDGPIASHNSESSFNNDSSKTVISQTMHKRETEAIPSPASPTTMYTYDPRDDDVPLPPRPSPVQFICTDRVLSAPLVPILEEAGSKPPLQCSVFRLLPRRYHPRPSVGALEDDADVAATVLPFHSLATTSADRGPQT